MNWIIKQALKIIIIGISVFITANYLTGMEVEGWGAAIFMSLLLAILNLLVRPILVLLTLPVTILTLGLFLFVINAALFWFAGMVVDGIEINGLIAPLIGALVVSIVSWILDLVMDRD